MEYKEIILIRRFTMIVKFKDKKQGKNLETNENEIGIVRLFTQMRYNGLLSGA